MNRKYFIQRSIFALTSAAALGSAPGMGLATPAPASGSVFGSGSVRSTTEKNICTACGTAYPSGFPMPQQCPICSDDRQYIPESGQEWTGLSTLETNFTILFTKINDRLYDLRMSPSFAIGQRAFLILSESGNILWDCIPLINEEAIAFIRSKGGLKAIAFSHPHYYSTMNEWARVFNCPIHIHRNDRQWIQDGCQAIHLWDGVEYPLWDGVKIINIGGHFAGSSILRIPSFSPNGVLLTGDSLYVSRSKRHIAIMYSYPNQISLPKKEMVRIREVMRGVNFDTVYGAFDWQNLKGNARDIFDRSMERYCAD